VREVSIDGHGHPIPVVTDFSYIPEQIGLDVKHLGISKVDRVAVLTEQSAKRHHGNLNISNATIVRGSNHLCVLLTEGSALSCQIVSPYPGNLPLVVYCIGNMCEMPALAINETLIISANWDDIDLSKPQIAGTQIADKIADIQEFVDTNSSR